MDRRPHVKTREAGRIVSVAVIVVVGVNTDGQREVLGLKVGASEAEPFWTEFLRSLPVRGGLAWREPPGGRRTLQASSRVGSKPFGPISVGAKPEADVP